jgi:hypothetical protein
MTTNRDRRIAWSAFACLLAAFLACSARRTGSDTTSVPQPDGVDALPAESGPAVETPATNDGGSGPAPEAVAAPGDGGAANASSVAVRWSVQSLFGGERIEISADGQVLYVVLAGPGSPGGQQQEYHGTLTPAELEGLRKTFDDNDLCEIESERETGIMDEGHPALEVHFPGMECTISLWDGEWLERSAPKACQEALHALARRFVPAS